MTALLLLFLLEYIVDEFTLFHRQARAINRGDYVIVRVVLLNDGFAFQHSHDSISFSEWGEETDGLFF